MASRPRRHTKSLSAVLTAAVAIGCGGQPELVAPQTPIVPSSAQLIGGSGYQEASAIALGPNGEIALAGAFAETFEYGGELLVGDGSVDGFLLLLDVEGNLLWLKGLSGPGEDAFTGLTFVGDSLFAGGYAAREALLSDMPVEVRAQGSALVTRFALDGSTEWIRTFDGDGYQRVASVTATPDGDVVVAGDFSGRIVLDNDITSEGASDAFVARLDQVGDLIWAKPIRGPGAEAARAVIADEAGGLVVSGWSDLALQAATHHHANHIAVSAFVQGFAADGEPHWSMEDVFSGAPSRPGGHASVEMPDLLARSADGFVFGATRGELFGLHGEDFEAPSLGTAILRGFDARQAELWRLELSGDAADIQLAALATSSQRTLVFGSLSGPVTIGAANRASKLTASNRSPFVLSLGAAGELEQARLLDVAPLLSEPRMAGATITAIAAAVREPGTTLAIATVAYADDDRDVLLLGLPAAAAP